MSTTEKESLVYFHIGGLIPRSYYPDVIGKVFTTSLVLCITHSLGSGAYDDAF